MSNLDLWNKVDTTDTLYTKRVNQRGGYTSISPQYQAKKATEQFGPYGKGWGLSHSDFDMTILDATGMVIHKAVFFYVMDGERIEFPISNATTIMMGTRADEDWPKKVETNTVSKALSKLGFCADVFMGLHDDGEYLNDLNNKLAIEKAADKDEEIAKQAKALSDDVSKVISQIHEAGSLNEVSGLFKAMFRRIGDKDKSLIISLTKAKDEAKERLSND